MMMNVDIKNHKKLLYMAGNLMYLGGWAITLIGLAMVQVECKDLIEDTNVRAIGLGGIPFFTEPVGEDCKKGFRCASQNTPQELILPFSKFKN